MAKVFKTQDSPNDKAMQQRLASLGVTLNADGSVSGNPFQGSVTPASGPDSIGPEGEVEQPGDPFGRIEEEQSEPEALPNPELAAHEQEVPESEETSEPRLKGLEKREADARAAQAAMSKTEARLKLMEASVNQKMADLDEHINRLASLQATVGPMPTDLNPADAETLANWREEQPEAIAVMEAVVSPLYALFSQMREQVNGMIQKQGEDFAKQRQAQVNEGIFSKIPQAKVKEITESPEFVDWLSRKPDKKKNLYVDILTQTSKYTPEEALEVFQEYAMATGASIGQNEARERPKMDRAPNLRSGGALPETQEAPRRNNNSTLTPLSQNELANVSRLLYEGSVEQRDHFRKRLELTLPSQDFSSWANA